MNGVQSKKAHNIEKPFPGCLGRMANLFDLTAGVTGNRLLTDKPHYDASSLSRSQSDASRITSPPFGEQIEDKQIVSDLTRTFSKTKINGTPIKMLIDKEMSKEVDSKLSSPNLVARLMGLDALPLEKPNLSVQGSHIKDNSPDMRGHSGMPFKRRQMDDRLMDKEMLCGIHQSAEWVDCKDIYETWQQSQRTNHVRDNSPEKGRWTEDVNGKKMAFIRQKFMEAKRLSTDERLRKSKEFNDALEVLSSNNDLLIRFLDSQNQYELQSFPSTETKRITVLKPSKMIDNGKSSVDGKRNDKQIKNLANVGHMVVWDKKGPHCSPLNQKATEYPVQPTRIVVLKPSPGKTHESKAVVSPTSLLPQNLQSGNVCQVSDNHEVLEPRKGAKETTQVQGNLTDYQRDEILYSSVFSNGYTGDESSFYKSENEYATGNFSDLEAMSPSPSHSWDYINHCSSPYSLSSFSRASCSPESSVCREAKKRLSERWAMMASNKGPQEQRLVRRSSTLGEMLALSDSKKSETAENNGVNKDQAPRGSVSCSGNFNEEICKDGSPKSLLRSKSVPISSTIYENGLSGEIYGPEAGRAYGFKELTKAKSMKASLKGKVTSLFFSRNKKSTREKSSLFQSKDESQSIATATSISPINSPGILREDASQSYDSGGFGGCSFPALYESSGKTLSDSVYRGQQGIVPLQPGLTVSKHMVPGISSENQDQPSPISVLEPPFQEDVNAAQESDCTKAGHLVGRVPLKSNLIDKSPPIESISRTLSWDDSVEVSSPYPLKPLTVSRDAKVEEQDWLVFVQKLLSAAGLDDQVQSNSFYSRWYSLESPLDPSLRDKYANLNDKEPLQEAKRRQRRSYQKLVFDFVNAALVEITGYESEKYLVRSMWSCSHNRLPEGSSAPLVDLLVAQIKELLSAEMRGVWGECGDSNSLVVGRIIRKEVVGKGWFESMGMEMDNLGKEIEDKLLEELVEEAVVDLTGRTSRGFSVL